MKSVGARSIFNARLFLSGTLLTTAIVFGGGGTPAPLAELIVQLVAIAVFVAWIWLVERSAARPKARRDVPLLVLSIAFVAIPAVQLIPLPPAIWHHLPAREIEVRALALVGSANAWMPWSMSPTRTLASLLSLIPPMVMLFFMWRLPRGEQTTMLGLLGGLGLVAALVGVVQLVSGNANWLRFYADTHYGFATGFQANRNADVDVLLIAAMALLAWIVSTGRVFASLQNKLLLTVFLFFMAVSLVLTGSRAGVGLIVVPIVFGMILFVPHVRVRGWKLAVGGAVVLSVLFVGGYALRDNARIQNTLQRFDQGAVRRPEIWADTVYAIKQHLPVGSGVGTFRPIYDAAERLEFVHSTYANRAHNDYLEYVLETGFVGPLLLFVGLIFLLWRGVAILRQTESRTRRNQILFALAGFSVFILHSLVDYPMRSMSLAVVCALLFGLMSGGADGPSRERRGKKRQGRRSARS
ncbi:hypothetical protein GCM10023219_29790 [Stakelama sediminis]|uniref:O-antigen ligase n=1 Tax=Stakelama sediminis TaxID=463200 RepID=A0A840Z345_9SPHN|nr:O-antigen ligase family protein [Stakelama sediminis]MBB5720293.1 O-antigen ligase [Stakelama sediminis]